MPEYDPVWAVCSELDMPVHVHSGAADRASYGEHVGIYVAEVRWWSTRPLWFLLWAGPSSGFPTLTFVTTECGAFWAPDLLWTSDIVYDREHAAKKLGKQLTDHLSMRPERVLRPELLHRCVEHQAARAGPALRDRRRQHHVGQRLPPPRRDLAAHQGVARQRILRHSGRRDPADPRLQRRRVLPLRHRGAPAARRPVRTDSRRARPDRRRSAASGPIWRPPAGPG